MPDDTLEDAAREAWASATKHIATFDPVEITHPTGGSFYLVNNKTALTFTLEDASTQEFEPVPYSMKRPKQGDTGSQELTFTVSNVDRRIGAFIDSVKNSQVPTVLKQRFYLSNDLTTPQRSEAFELTVVDVSVSSFQVTLRARFVDVLNRPVPNEKYTRARFPGLGN